MIDSTLFSLVTVLVQWVTILTLGLVAGKILSGWIDDYWRLYNDIAQATLATDSIEKVTRRMEVELAQNRFKQEKIVSDREFAASQGRELADIEFRKIELKLQSDRLDVEKEVALQHITNVDSYMVGQLSILQEQLELATRQQAEVTRNNGEKIRLQDYAIGNAATLARDVFEHEKAKFVGILDFDRSKHAHNVTVHEAEKEKERRKDELAKAHLDLAHLHSNQDHEIRKRSLENAGLVAPSPIEHFMDPDAMDAIAEKLANQEQKGGTWYGDY